MKTSTFSFSSVILFLLLISNQIWGQNEPILNLVTTLKSEGANQMIFEPKGELEVSFWNKEYLQLSIQIDSSDLRREQIKAMVPLGFFKPKTVLEGTCLVLKMPGIERSTLFNGKEITWKIRYTLLLPNSIQVIRKVNEFSRQ